MWVAQGKLKVVLDWRQDKDGQLSGASIFCYHFGWFHACALVQLCSCKLWPLCSFAVSQLCSCTGLNARCGLERGWEAILCSFKLVQLCSCCDADLCLRVGSCFSSKVDLNYLSSRGKGMQKVVLLASSAPTVIKIGSELAARCTCWTLGEHTTRSRCFRCNLLISTCTCSRR